MKASRDESGQFPAYAWPGGYPIIYVMEDGGTLCPDCMNKEEQVTTAPEEGADPGWHCEGMDIHWEGPAETCCNCNAQIESAYGDPHKREE